MDEFADGLAAHGLEFSTDVQWVTQAYNKTTGLTGLTALLGAVSLRRRLLVCLPACLLACLLGCLLRCFVAGLPTCLLAPAPAPLRTQL